jgi:hypothetical protein
MEARRTAPARLPVRKHLLADVREDSARTTQEINGHIQLIVLRSTVSVGNCTIKLVGPQRDDDSLSEVGQCESVC